MNLAPILNSTLEDHALPLGGDHRVAHWARVLENGLQLAKETGAAIEVVSLFAVLHDSRRINEVTDPEYRPRAEFAAELRGWKSLEGASGRTIEADFPLAFFT